MNKCEIQKRCYDIVNEGLPWDFYEDADDVLSHVFSSTTPGRLVKSLSSDINSNCDRHRILNLFIAYAARLSLACWFEYCDNLEPFDTTQSIIDSLIKNTKIDYKLNSHYLHPCVPMENGVPIVDCRESDTFSASLSVAYAAAYNSDGSDAHAAYSLSYAFIAIDVSPVRFDEPFVDWLLNKDLLSSLDLAFMPPECLLMGQMRARHLI